ncbi:unnamed protein product [Phaeothamnion confervicola]
MIFGISLPARAEQAADTGAVTREVIPGSELMTHQERERYRRRLRGAKSPADAQQIQGEHVRQMRERARLRGLRLPEEKPAGEGAR